MPQPDGDHSRQLNLAAPGGKVRLEINLYSAVEGKAGVVQETSKAGQQGGGGCIGR